MMMVSIRFYHLFSKFSLAEFKQNTGVQQLLCIAWKSASDLQQPPFNLIVLQDGAGKHKPEPIGPNPKGALLFFLSFILFFNWSALLLSPVLRLPQHFLLTVPLRCICFVLS